MHEMSIVAGLIDVVTTHAARHGARRVRRVRVKVGRLCAVEAPQLQACFDLLAAGTVAAGAELLIDEVGVRGRCRDCGKEFAVPRYRFVCPVCAGCRIAVIAGQELYVESFDADDTSPAP